MASRELKDVPPKTAHSGRSSKRRKGKQEAAILVPYCVRIVKSLRKLQGLEVEVLSAGCHPSLLFVEREREASEQS